MRQPNHDPAESLDAAVRAMVEEAALRGAVPGERLTLARQRDYWRQLNPDLAVEAGEPRPVPESAPLDAEARQAVLERFESTGYFTTGPVLCAQLMRRMRSAIDLVRGEGWHPTFALVYDEFWEIVRARSVVALIEGVLGPGYRQLPKSWTFHVPTTRGGSGWPPHMDGAARQNRLTVWIPLTRATTENGCMYVVPRSSCPERVRVEWATLKDIERDELTRLLQGARALPAEPGSLHGWAFDILHWGSEVIGSKVIGANECRVSVAHEFISAAEPPWEDDLPLLPAGAVLPSFPERLCMIGGSLLAYSKFDARALRYRELAGELGRIQ